MIYKYIGKGLSRITCQCCDCEVPLARIELIFEDGSKAFHYLCEYCFESGIALMVLDPDSELGNVHPFFRMLLIKQCISTNHILKKLKLL